MHHSNPENIEMMFYKIIFPFFYLLGNKSNNSVLHFLQFLRGLLFSTCSCTSSCSIVSFILVISAKNCSLAQNRSPLPLWAKKEKSQTPKKFLWFHQNFTSKTTTFRSPRMFWRAEQGFKDLRIMSSSIN